MKRFDIDGMEPRERYQLLTRLVAPRPIALVSTCSADGVGNLAPFSFFAVGGSSPPSCVICPTTARDGADKDTLVNIRATGDYVINIVSEPLAEQISQASWSYPPEVDEIDEVGFTREPSAVVRPPRVAQSPAALECRAFEIVDHGHGPLSSHWIIGEILAIHVADEVLTDGLPDNRKLAQLARLGEEWYLAAHPDRLRRIPRPTGP